MRPAVLLLALLMSAPARAQIRSISIDPPSRVVGVLVGDTLSAKATIAVGSDTVLDAASLPSAGPLTPSIDIRGVSVALQRDAAGLRYTIRLVYQNFTTPDHVSSVDVPGFTVAFKQSGKRFAVQVAGFSFSASPIQDANMVVTDSAALRPDQPFMFADIGAPTRMIAAGCAIAMLAGCALAATLGVVPYRPRHAAPFSAALAAMRSVADDTAAFLRLHRAFDETAGKPVLAEDLDIFFANHPRFDSLRPEIEAFFAASRHIFFGTRGMKAAPSAERLARALARAERWR
jgi:mxaA protein